MDNLPINSYGLLYSPGECYSREEAKEIIKEIFFNPLPVQEQEEDEIQVCCPSYEGKYPKIPIPRIISMMFPKMSTLQIIRCTEFWSQPDFRDIFKSLEKILRCRHDSGFKFFHYSRISK